MQPTLLKSKQKTVIKECELCQHSYLFVNLSRGVLHLYIPSSSLHTVAKYYFRYFPNIKQDDVLLLLVGETVKGKKGLFESCGKSYATLCSCAAPSPPLPSRDRYNSTIISVQFHKPGNTNIKTLISDVKASSVMALELAFMLLNPEQNRYDYVRSRVYECMQVCACHMAHKTENSKR
jgi:hypothetical protein